MTLTAEPLRWCISIRLIGWLLTADDDIEEVEFDVPCVVLHDDDSVLSMLDILNDKLDELEVIK